MVLQLKSPLLLLLCIIAITTHAQQAQSLSLNIGDTAPPLRVSAWLKGTPVQQFEKGHVYVLEFWATWCKPCVAAIPHLSALAREYRDKVTIVGVDIYEGEIKSVKSADKVKAFVDSMGNRIDFSVAAEDSNFTVADWIGAMGDQYYGIPRTFVVNAEGLLAWAGHPKDLNEVLHKIVDNTWDVNEALTKRNEEKHFEELESAASEQLDRYVGDALKPGDFGKPDSALLVINELVSKNPELKYTSTIVRHTFSSLLKTDSHKACEYGKTVLETPAYEEPPYLVFIDAIEWYSIRLNHFPAEVYELGAEAEQARIDRYGEDIDIPKAYNKMADFYWYANNKSKALDAGQKAIKALKRKKNFSETDMAELKSRLQQYQDM